MFKFRKKNQILKFEETEPSQEEEKETIVETSYDNLYQLSGENLDEVENLLSQQLLDIKSDIQDMNYSVYTISKISKECREASENILEFKKNMAESKICDIKTTLEIERLKSENKLQIARNELEEMNCLTKTVLVQCETQAKIGKSQNELLLDDLEKMKIVAEKTMDIIKSKSETLELLKEMREKGIGDKKNLNETIKNLTAEIGKEAINLTNLTAGLNEKINVEEKRSEELKEKYREQLESKKISKNKDEIEFVPSIDKEEERSNLESEVKNIDYEKNSMQRLNKDGKNIKRWREKSKDDDNERIL
ncbi:hypothetical protein [Clostridium sp.]|uniref:hypothetical protein n=1 Tax=Clostridium sp. TaxID=1506 RepID=UPI001B44661A|nr:hypothetical protein [Clostridium sp.]MBP3915676.1 hypothetical protein [Clostridium sp.]